MYNIKTLYKFCLSRIFIYNFSLLQLKSLGKLSIGFYFNVIFQLIRYLPVNVSFPLFLSTERLLLFWHFVKSVISLLRWNFTLFVCVIYCLVCLVCLLDYSISFGFKCYFAVYGKKLYIWILNHRFKLYTAILTEGALDHTAWKVSVFGVILIRIFLRSDYIRTDTKYGRI